MRDLCRIKCELKRGHQTVNLAVNSVGEPQDFFKTCRNGCYSSRNALTLKFESNLFSHKQKVWPSQWNLNIESPATHCITEWLAREIQTEKNKNSLHDRYKNKFPTPNIFISTELKKTSMKLWWFLYTVEKGMNVLFKHTIPLKEWKERLQQVHNLKNPSLDVLYILYRNLFVW